jgi:hypothetical protein
MKTKDGGIFPQLVHAIIDGNVKRRAIIRMSLLDNRTEPSPRFLTL